MSKFMGTSSNTITEKLVGSDQVLISYVTDIEGNLNYWNNFLDISKVVKVTDAAAPGAARDLSLIDGSMFVYGGDVCDRSYGDLRVISDLLHLKEKYPDRVFLVLGNRDINKLRLTTELLVPEDMTHQPATDGVYEVYWVRSGFPNASLNGAVKFVEAKPPPCMSLEEYRINKLKWVSVLCENSSVVIISITLIAVRATCISLLCISLITIDSLCGGFFCRFSTGAWVRQLPSKRVA
jgi:hypothetical protein